MDTNSVSPMPELAPIAEFDKTPPTPPEDTLPMDDLPPPPTTVHIQDEKTQDEKSVGDRFGLSKSGCWNILYRMCGRILEMNRRYKIITFPTTDRAVQIMNNFQGVNGFPGIIGAVDGCHIRIEKPKDHPNSYINRKGFPSILLQGICDNNKLFIDVYAGEPGSIHDARLFRKSDIHMRTMNGEIEFPNDSHLIGDLAYTLSTKLLVGFKDTGHLTDSQKHFNNKLSQLRVVIENAFGMLKGRFRRLKFMETRRLDLIPSLIVSACILHNICMINNDVWEVRYDEVGNDEDYNEAVEGAAAIEKRNNIVNYLYNIHNAEQ